MFGNNNNFGVGGFGPGGGGFPPGNPGYPNYQGNNMPGFGFPGNNGPYQVGPNAYEQRTYQWAGARGGNSCCAMFFGVALVAVSIVILFYAEGQAVYTYRCLKDGMNQVVTVPSDRVDPSYDGKLIHTYGNVAPEEPRLSDALLVNANIGPAVEANRALSLRRNVEMYQWVEHETSHTEDDRLAGGKTTVKRYNYSTEWRSSPISSNSFKVSSGHYNPDVFPVSAMEIKSRRVTLGLFTIDVDRASQFSYEKIIINNLRQPSNRQIQSNMQQRSDSVALAQRSSEVNLSGAYLYVGNPAYPRVGDVRITWDYMPSGAITVVAMQQKNSFKPFSNSKGCSAASLYLVEAGEVGAITMIENAISSNETWKWMLRFGMGFLMFVGYMMIMQPFVEFSAMIPLIGGFVSSIIGWGTFMISIICAGCTASLVVCVAWFWLRPITSCVIFAAIIGLWVFLRRSAPTAAAARPRVE